MGSLSPLCSLSDWGFFAQILCRNSLPEKGEQAGKTLIPKKFSVPSKTAPSPSRVGMIVNALPILCLFLTSHDLSQKPLVA